MNSSRLSSAPLESARHRSPLHANRAIAIVAWLIGALATWLGLAVFLPGAPWWMPLTVAIITQAVLTVGERAIWHGRPSLFGLAALVIDVALNAGGLYPYALRVGDTPAAKMIVSVFGGARQVAPISAMIVAVVIGFLIAAAPEELWSRRD